MSDRIVDGTNIDTSVFAYSAPKAHASGGKVVNLNHKNFKESLTIATPLILTWGAQEGKDQQGNPTGKYTMSLQFPNAEYPNADCDAFLTNMRALESKVKADAMTYSKEWFGKSITSSEVMDEKFNVMLRHPKIKGTIEADLSKPPTLTAKVPCWNGVWQSEIYDEDGEALFVKGKINPQLNPLEFLQPKTHVICLLQCGGLWFVNGKVSITWNLKQAIVQKPRSTLEGQCLLKPKVHDKEKLKSMPAPDMVDPDGAVESVLVEDSDEEDEDEVEVVVKPKPVVGEWNDTSIIPDPVSLAVKNAAVAAASVPPPVPVEEPKKKKVVKKKVEA